MDFLTSNTYISWLPQKQPWIKNDTSWSFSCRHCLFPSNILPAVLNYHAGFSHYTGTAVVTS